MTQRIEARALDLLTTPLEDGTTVIEASAGTGKTYCLTGLVLRLLLERRVESIGHILVVTFTNAATDELVGRIRTALRDAHAALIGSTPAADPFVQGLVERHGSGEGAETLRNALLDFDDMLVSTIHGFCKRVLEESAFESGLVFDPELLESDDALRLDAARDAWRRLLVEDPTGELARLAASRGMTPETFAEDSRELGRHPGTEIVPDPLGVAGATAQLTAARETLASLWRGAKIRLFLSRRSWKPRAELADAGAQRKAIAAVDAFCAGRSGPVGVEALTTLRLADQLRDPVDELAREPAFAALDAVSEAAWELEHAVRCRMLADVESGLADAKERGGLLAFDDLLHRLDRALWDPRHGPRLRRAVGQTLKVALVDEFQDTDLVQYRIFRDLFRRGPLFLVGDPKQAIYRFRGADVFAYLEAKRHADRVYTLGRNWRSSGDLVQAVNALFDAERPFVYRDIPHPEVRAAERVASQRLAGDEGRSFQLHWLGEESSSRRAEARLVRWTASEIVGLLASDLRLVSDEDTEGRSLRPADVAVLVRTNQQAESVQEGLRRAGVPAVVSRSGDVFHSEELEELERVLRAVLDPGDRGRLKAACATLLWGMDSEDLHRLSDDGEGGGDEFDAGDRWQQLYDDFDGLRTVWRDAGFVAMARRWLDAQGVRERLLKLRRGERRLTNLLHGIELLARAIHDERLTPAGLVGWLAAERRRASHERDATELRLESDAAAVEIATVHKAKGLEYEVVLCPFLWQARPVDGPPVTVHADGGQLLREAGSWRVDQGLSDVRVERHVAMAEAERLAEDLRLLYVAVTRARRRCLVAWGAIGRGTASAASGLAYLLHRRQGVIDPDMDPSVWTLSALEQTRERAGAWHGDLRRWAEQHSELVGLHDIENEAAADWRPESDEVPELTSRRLPVEVQSDVRKRLTPWQIASFSSFSRSAPKGPSHHPAADGHRELPDRSDPALPVPDIDSRNPADPEGIFAFARGPRAGQCLHDVLEALDFPATIDADRESEVRELVRGQLKRFGLASPDAHDAVVGSILDPEDVVVDLLRRLATVQFPEGPRLASVRRPARLTEWQFWAPLQPVSGADLAAVFRRHARAEWAESYAHRLEELSPRQVDGYLTGYADLAFEYGDRFFVVDWKSNHLGNSVVDYDRHAMVRAMEEHHYFLQYHLYVVALRRYLRARGDLRSYDDTFGPVYYVFLRGLGELERTRRPGQMGLFGEPAADGDGGWDLKVSADTGVFVDRPPRELIEALDEILFVSLPERAA